MRHAPNNSIWKDREENSWFFWRSRHEYNVYLEISDDDDNNANIKIVVSPFIVKLLWEDMKEQNRGKKSNMCLIGYNKSETDGDYFGLVFVKFFSIIIYPFILA